MGKLRKIKLQITGRVASKKNQRTGIRRGGKYIVVYSKAWQRFEQSALEQLKNLNFTTLKPPYRVDYVFEMRGKGATDVDNMMAGINDVLEKSGLIENDMDILEGSYAKVRNAEEYVTSIMIEEINGGQ